MKTPTVTNTRAKRPLNIVTSILALKETSAASLQTDTHKSSNVFSHALLGVAVSPLQQWILPPEASPKLN